MKIKKIILKLFATLATLVVIESCSSHERSSEEKPLATTQDCSTIFESRGDYASSLNNENANETTIKECKILEVKVDDNTKCEAVGSDRIDKLSASLKKNKENKVILITSEKKLQDITDLANKYLASSGVEIKKYLDAEAFNNFPFPYKGLRCYVEDKEFILWKGGQRVIFTIGNK